MNKKGFILLITVLVIGAVATAIAVGLLNLGSGATTSSIYLTQSFQAKALADACAEEGLQQIRDSTPFAGTGSLIIGQGDCSYAVTNTGGSNRIVNTTGTVGMVVRKVRVTITAINPYIVVSSWQEI
ncbi:MAG TPA: hypothetical protein PLV72_02135 [Candidatus Magasanikbacteria bacterium]|nr:hypothetical protein [Candidatus Magasanikbacteria bacterium]